VGAIDHRLKGGGSLQKESDFWTKAIIGSMILRKIIIKMWGTLKTRATTTRRVTFKRREAETLHKELLPDTQLVQARGKVTVSFLQPKRSSTQYST